MAKSGLGPGAKTIIGCLVGTLSWLSFIAQEISVATACLFRATVLSFQKKIREKEKEIIDAKMKARGVQESHQEPVEFFDVLEVTPVCVFSSGSEGRQGPPRGSVLHDFMFHADIQKACKAMTRKTYETQKTLRAHGFWFRVASVFGFRARQFHQLQGSRHEEG